MVADHQGCQYQRPVTAPCFSGGNAATSQAAERTWKSPCDLAWRPGGWCVLARHGAERYGVARRVDGWDAVLQMLRDSPAIM
jgi:hypothetical protein